MNWNPRSPSLLSTVSSYKYTETVISLFHSMFINLFSYSETTLDGLQP